MIDSENLHNLTQLVENLENLTNKLEKAYNKNDAEDFNSVKKDILETQKKISSLIK
jgi:hypothetical protein